MFKIVLLRHSLTAGNLLKRYIGTTDEELCPEGIALLKRKTYLRASELFVSPMLRCTQTASIIYPGQRMHILEDLRECDFGEFENKNYQELSQNPNYQKWVDSNGLLPFPEGESRQKFSKRCVTGFDRVMSYCISHKLSSAAIIAHGGTIMSIMEAYAVPQREYYDWQVENGCGYLLEIDEVLWQNQKKGIIVKGFL